ncbi:class I SAM-dependent methyltransferase [Natrialbaceae archaeon A-CW2]
MNVLSAVGKRAVATAKAQVAALRTDGVVTYLRSRPRAALGSLGIALLTLDSLRMSPTEVQNEWAGRSGHYSPEFYAEYGPDTGTEAILEALEGSVDTDDSILELGCGGGRHLAALHDHGYENLHGIDINEDAGEVIERNYPHLEADGTFYFDAIEDVVPTFETDAFDVVFSVETLQHIHPDNAWVFEDIARVTDDRLLTMENEPDGDELLAVTNVDDFPLYFRNWERIFGDLGWRQVHSSEGDIDTFRVFEKQ